MSETSGYRPPRDLWLGPQREVEATVDDDTIERLARHVRALYCMCYRERNKNSRDYGSKPIPRWDGGEGAHGNYKPIWPSIAATILQCQADPYLFIRFPFFEATNVKSPPPNTFVGEKAAERWRLYSKSAKECLELRVKSEQNVIRVEVLPLTVNLHWAYPRALNYVLHDTQKAISPLLRYSYAATEDLAAIMESYFQSAAAQYMFQPADYDELLPSEFVPAQIKDEAARMRSLLIGR